MSVTSVGATTASSNERTASMAQDFDTFLKLLTTQLANQDPLSPMDSNQFTQQLVQFASVEQALATNTKLDELVSYGRTTGLAAGTQYLSREVVAEGRTMRLEEQGTTDFVMNVEEKPASLTIRVFDESGERVATLEPEPAEGWQTVVWDGRGDDGFRELAGTYTVAVDARDASGTPLEVSTKLKGVVDSVETTDDGVFLFLGDRRIALDDVLAVNEPTAASTSPSSGADPDTGFEGDSETNPGAAPDSTNEDEGASS